MTSGPRVLVGVALLLGIGIVARYCFQEYIVSAVANPEAFRPANMGDWKPVKVEFTGARMGQPFDTTQKMEFSQPPTLPSPTFPHKR